MSPAAQATVRTLPRAAPGSSASRSARSASCSATSAPARCTRCRRCSRSTTTRSSRPPATSTASSRWSSGRSRSSCRSSTSRSSCAPTTTARAGSWRWPRSPAGWCTGGASWSRSRWRSACSARRCSTATASSPRPSRCCRPSKGSRSRPRSFKDAVLPIGHRHPGGAVRRPALRHPRRRPVLRPGHGAVVRRAGRHRRAASIVRNPAIVRGAVAALHRLLRRRPPVPGLHRDGRGGAGDHRRGGALRRHGPLRPLADPAGVVRARVPLPDAQLPGAGRARTQQPEAVGNPFYLLVPSWARIPLVVLATLATVIASQAVISGAFSVSRQAVRLGFLPNLTVRHTSTRGERADLRAGGQLAAVRRRAGAAWWPSAPRQAGHRVRPGRHRDVADHDDAVPHRRRDGVAVGARGRSSSSAWSFGVVEVSYFAANLTKIVHGGWLPLVIAVVVVTAMTTWQRGRRIVTRRRTRARGPAAGLRRRAARAQADPGARHRRVPASRARRRRRSRCAPTSSTTTCCTSTS